MNYAERHVLETLIYLPMLAALVLVFVPRPQKTVIRWISIGSAIALLVMSVYAFLAFDYDGGARFQLQRSYPWLEILGIEFAMGIDGISAPMSGTTFIRGLGRIGH